MQDWNGRDVRAGQSRSGVVLLADFADNLIRDASRPWPPPPIVQKLYESKHGLGLPFPSRELVSERLGFYSDLQSVHSEDAITWSYFGPLASSHEAVRGRFLDWLLARLGVDAPHHSTCTIDLWRRVPHPDKPLPGGPELDFVIDGEHCVVFGEAKWFSAEGSGQGRAKDKTQLQLRREFFEKYGGRIYGQRTFVVLGLDLDGSLPRSAPEPTAADTVLEARLTWADLAGFAEHPASGEFRRYLKWKHEHSVRRRPERSPADTPHDERAETTAVDPEPPNAASADFTHAGLEARGFHGFRSFAELGREGLGEVPAEGGVYVVVRASDQDPEFISTSIGGHFKGQDPTVPIDQLEENWIAGAHVLYIGKANVLKRRLLEFVRFGQGKPIGHRGGRLIWQTAGSQDLVIAWKTTPGESPETVERTLIGEFQAANAGRLPFANLR